MRIRHLFEQGGTRLRFSGKRPERRQPTTTKEWADFLRAALPEFEFYQDEPSLGMVRAGYRSRRYDGAYQITLHANTDFTARDKDDRSVMPIKEVVIALYHTWEHDGVRINGEAKRYFEFDIDPQAPSHQQITTRKTLIERIKKLIVLIEQGSGPRLFGTKWKRVGNKTDPWW